MWRSTQGWKCRSRVRIANAACSRPLVPRGDCRLTSETPAGCRGDGVSSFVSTLSTPTSAHWTARRATCGPARPYSTHSLLSDRLSHDVVSPAGDGQVLVRFTLRPVQTSDLSVARGLYGPRDFPSVLGGEGMMCSN